MRTISCRLFLKNSTSKLALEFLPKKLEDQSFQTVLNRIPTEKRIRDQHEQSKILSNQIKDSIGKSETELEENLKSTKKTSPSIDPNLVMGVATPEGKIDPDGRIFVDKGQEDENTAATFVLVVFFGYLFTKEFWASRFSSVVKQEEEEEPKIEVGAQSRTEIIADIVKGQAEKSADDWINLYSILSTSSSNSETNAEEEKKDDNRPIEVQPSEVDLSKVIEEYGKKEGLLTREEMEEEHMLKKFSDPEVMRVHSWLKQSSSSESKENANDVFLVHSGERQAIIRHYLSDLVHKETSRKLNQALTPTSPTSSNGIVVKWARLPEFVSSRDNSIDGESTKVPNESFSVQKLIDTIQINSSKGDSTEYLNFFWKKQLETMGSTGDNETVLLVLDLASSVQSIASRGKQLSTKTAENIEQTYSDFYELVKIASSASRKRVKVLLLSDLDSRIAQFLNLQQGAMG